MTDNRTRQIRYPLPQVPTEVQSVEVRDYLTKFRQSVEANLNALFATEPISGQRLAAGTVPEDRLDFAVNIPVDFSIPLMTWTFLGVDGGIPKWTAAQVTFNGIEYPIDAWEAGDTTANTRGIYWASSDIGNGEVQTKLYGEDTPLSEGSSGVAIYKWFMAFFDGTDVYSAFQSPIIHGGLIQANTIIASNVIVNETITADEILTNTITVTQMGPNSVTDTELNSSTLNANTSKLSGIDSGATNDQTGQEIRDASGWVTQTTKIDGGQIFTNTIVADSIDTTDLFAQDITFTNAIHTAAKTAYADDDDGIWIGIDTVPKFNIGNATKHLKWDGTDIIINGVKGTLGADGDNFYDIDGKEIQLGTATDYVNLAAAGLEIRTTDGIGRFQFYAFSTNTSIGPVISLGKSHHASSQIETVPGEALGLMRMQGVNSNNNKDWGAGIEVIQDGAAGATWVPAKLRILTTNGSGVLKIATFDKDGNLTVAGGFSGSGSALTGLNATQLIGTIADARMPSTWGQFNSGTYVGNGYAGSVDKTVALGFAATVVYVKKVDNAQSMCVVDASGGTRLTASTSINAVITGTNLVISDSDAQINSNGDTYRFFAFG